MALDINFYKVNISLDEKFNKDVGFKYLKNILLHSNRNTHLDCICDTIFPPFAKGGIRGRVIKLLSCEVVEVLIMYFTTFYIRLHRINNYIQLMI